MNDNCLRSDNSVQTIALLLITAIPKIIKTVTWAANKIKQLIDVENINIIYPKVLIDNKLID